MSAQVDRLVLEAPHEQGGGPGTGHWGMFEAADAEVAEALLAAAEGWLRERGMTRSMGPFSLSIWDEPGLLVKGFDHSPTVLMGHNQPDYEAWVESAGYPGVKDPSTYELDIKQQMPPLLQTIRPRGDSHPTT